MATRTTEANGALLRLMQLASPALPVGAYAYSHGLEHAVTAGWVRDEESAAHWVVGLMEHPLAALDVPVLARMYRAWQSGDGPSVERWSDFLTAARESAELAAEDRHLGTALARLLAELGVAEAGAWAGNLPTCFATMWALAAQRWGIPLREAVCGYLWSWCENQVAAAVRLVPLGQTAGQRIVSLAIERIPDAVDCGLALADDDIGLSVPALAIGSALHETQYSRLFRS